MKIVFNSLTVAIFYFKNQFLKSLKSICEKTSIVNFRREYIWILTFNKWRTFLEIKFIHNLISVLVSFLFWPFDSDVVQHGYCVFLLLGYAPVFIILKDSGICASEMNDSVSTLTSTGKWLFSLKGLKKPILHQSKPKMLIKQTKAKKMPWYRHLDYKDRVLFHYAVNSEINKIVLWAKHVQRLRLIHRTSESSILLESKSHKTSSTGTKLNES